MYTVALLFLAAACRSGEGLVLRGGATATPISTPLPSVPTAIPAGAQENPLQMVVLAAGDMAAAEEAAPLFEAAVFEATNPSLSIEVVLVERYAEALAALCDSNESVAAISWLNGPTYVAATAQRCGSPTLQIEKAERGAARINGQAGEIVMNSQLGLGSVAALSGRDFCRLGIEDFFSWFVPSLVMQTNGVDPISDLGTVKDFEDIPAMLTAVAEGECAAAGVPAGALEAFDSELGAARDQLRVLETTIEFPFDILMYPPEVQLGVQLALDEAFVELASGEETAEMVNALLGQERLIRVNATDFDEFQAFVESTGLEFGQLGN